MISFNCPGCGKTYSVRDDFAGKKTKCPKCGTAIVVPSRYDQAIADLTEAIRLDPKNADNYALRGECYAQTFEHDQAIADFAESIRLDPKDAANCCERGRSYAEKCEYEKAIAYYTEAIRLNPNAANYCDRGWCYLDSATFGALSNYDQMLQYDKAIADFTEAIRIDPKNAENYGRRAECHGRKHEYDKAIADHTEAIRLDPKNAEHYFARAIAYEEASQTDKAIADFTEIIRLDPKNARGYHSRAQSYARTGEYDKAIGDYTKLIRLDPKNAYAHDRRVSPHYHRGRCYAQTGEYDKAIADFSEAIRLEPRAIEAYRERGWCDALTGEHDNAIADLTEANRLGLGTGNFPCDVGSDIDRNRVIADFTEIVRCYLQKLEHDKAIADLNEPYFGHVAHVYFNRGWSYGQNGEHNKAIADLTEAIRLHDRPYGQDDVSAHGIRGISYAETGEHEKAIADFHKAILLYPKNADNYRNRGLCYARKGEYAKAIADFTRSIRIAPDNFDAQAAMAWLGATCPDQEMRDGKSADEHDKAIADYTEAIRLDPKAAANYYGRGECHALTGSFEKAIADFTDAIRLERAAAYHYVWRASSYAEKGEHGEAIVDFTNAIQLDPQDADAYIGRAFCYFVISAHDKAVADFEATRWLKSKAGLDPVTADACERVIAGCTRRIRLDPTDAVAYYNRSWRYAQKGDYERAIDDFSEAVRLDPTLPEENKPQVMQTVVMMLSNKSQDGLSPIKSPAELMLRCLNKVGVTGGKIIGAGYGLGDDEGDDESDAALGKDGSAAEGLRVAVVVRLEELIDLRDSPPASDDDDMVVELTDEPAALGKMWGMILLLALRDNATSVHYHPWREDGVLAYIVANVRHVLEPPPDELSETMVAVARSLFTEPVQGGLLARLGGLLARLGGRTVSGLSCGAFELDVWGNVLVWHAVVWSSGGRAGVELFRVAPPAVTEQRHAEPDVAAEGGV